MGIIRDMEDEIEFTFVREIDNVEVAVDVSYEPEAKMEDILSEIMDVEDLEIGSFEKDDLTLYVGEDKINPIYYDRAIKEIVIQDGDIIDIKEGEKEDAK